MAGRLELSGGQVTLNSAPLSKDLRRKISYVLQSDTFLPELTFWETIWVRSSPCQIQIPYTALCQNLHICVYCHNIYGFLITAYACIVMTFLAFSSQHIHVLSWHLWLSHRSICMYCLPFSSLPYWGYPNQCLWWLKMKEWMKSLMIWIWEDALKQVSRLTIDCTTKSVYYTPSYIIDNR